jgi:hypothetical protein
MIDFEPIQDDAAQAYDLPDVSFEEYLRQELPRNYRNRIETAITDDDIDDTGTPREGVLDRLEGMITEVYEATLTAYRARRTSQSSRPTAQLISPPESDAASAAGQQSTNQQIRFGASFGSSPSLQGAPMTREYSGQGSTSDFDFKSEATYPNLPIPNCPQSQYQQHSPSFSHITTVPPVTPAPRKQRPGNSSSSQDIHVSQSLPNLATPQANIPRPAHSFSNPGSFDGIVTGNNYSSYEDLVWTETELDAFFAQQPGS